MFWVKVRLQQTFAAYWFWASGRRWGQWWRLRLDLCRAPSPASRCPSSAEETSGHLKEEDNMSRWFHPDLWPHVSGGSLTDVVDGAVVAAQDEEGSGRVVAVDGNHVLVLQSRRKINPSNSRSNGTSSSWWLLPPPCDSTHLPVFGDGVPDADLPGVAGGDQLVTDEEQSLSRNVEAEDACRRKETWSQAPPTFYPSSSSSTALGLLHIGGGCSAWFRPSNQKRRRLTLMKQEGTKTRNKPGKFPF